MTVGIVVGVAVGEGVSYVGHSVGCDVGTYNLRDVGRKTGLCSRI